MRLLTIISSLCKKTPNTALFLFPNQSSRYCFCKVFNFKNQQKTKSGLLRFRNFESLVFDFFLSKTGKLVVFLQTLSIIISTAFSVFAQNSDFFQQQVNYYIDVTLDDELNTLEGNLKIVYINNSPDELNYIYFHLYPNAYKNNSTAFAQQQLFLRSTKFFFADDSKRGYIDSLQFTVNGENANFVKDIDHIDIGKLYLPQKLNSKDTVIIETSFYVKIPEISSRFGHKNNTYFITHWHPKPAVYDKNGWNPMPYLDMGEFYQDFGYYNVKINLPKPYIVAATGDLVSREELHRLEDYAEDNNKGIKSNAFNYKDSTGNKTLHYITDKVIDFAWFASKDFIVNSKPVHLPNSNKYVICKTFYLPENKYVWEDAINYLTQSVSFFSDLLGDYPYKYMYAVDAHYTPIGGMEYPGVVLATGYTDSFLERIIAHEVAHNWFYAALASNERDEPWIDEGFTSYYEERYTEKYLPELTMAEELFGYDIKLAGLNNLPAKYMREFSWQILKRENISQYPGLKSVEFSPPNYYVMLYNKPVVAIKTLEKYLGREKFDSIMQSFYQNYKFKHISEKDIAKHFSKYTNSDLSWFFEDLINSDRKPDYGVRKAVNDSIIIKNLGEVNSPVFLYIGDSLVISDGFSGEKSFYYNNIDNVIIDKNFYSLDYNRSNNYYYPNFADRIKSIKPRFANIIEMPFEKNIGYFPLLGYNYYDGIMPGLILYRSIIPKNKFEYQIAPMFGTKSLNPTGIINLSGFIHPQDKPIREIELFAKTKKFSIDNKNQDYYLKFSGGTNIVFNTPFTSHKKSELMLRNILASDIYQPDTLRNYQHIKYSFTNYRILNPYSFNINLEKGNSYLKSWIEYQYKINYSIRNKGLNIRVFTGCFLYNNTNLGVYNLRLSGNSGSDDYLYDYLFLGRSEDIRNSAGTFPAHQFARNQGGFAIYTPWGQSNKWLASVNLSTSLPLPFIKLYANFAAVADNVEFFKIGNFFYEAGIEFELIPKVCSVFFPVFTSPEIWETSNNFYTENYLQKVRFTLYLEKINPFLYRDKFHLLY